MTVKQGYKLTEVGVIPEDWEVCCLGDLCSFENGDRSSNYPSAKKFVTDGIPFINAGHISDGIINLKKMDFISDSVFNQLGGGKVVAGDFLFCLRGSLGKFGFVDACFGKGAIASSLVIVRPKVNKIFHYYLYSYFKSNTCKQMILLWAGGAAQPNLGAKELALFLLPLPSIPEQTAIANALSDADAYINSLEQLITKKQQIKQGTMQELLTGKKRLEGFSGEWEEKKLGDFAHCYSGGTPSTSVPEYYNGNIPWITSSDLNRQYIFEVNGRLSEIGLKNSSAQIVKKDCLLIALYGATAGVSAITKIEAAINQAVLAVIFNEQNTYFFYFLFSLLKTKLIETYTQGGQPNLSGAIIKSIQLRIPTLPEQTAIANILTHMDNDIQELQNKLTKAKHIKQGMMQELLTGKTRLVQPH